MPLSIEFRKAESSCELIPSARAVLIDVETDDLAHLVPVEVDFAQMRVLAHHRGNLFGRAPQLAEVFAGNAELNRKADRRAVLEPQHARA